MDLYKQTFMRYKTRLQKSFLFTRGIPFILFMFGASLAMQQFNQIRYDFSQGRKMTHKQREALERQKKKDLEILTLEQEHERLMETMAEQENWENIRGPRPWEDPKATQELERELAQLKTKKKSWT